MKIDVKSAIVDILKREGVEYVFGHTGSHIMDLWEGIYQSGLKIILNKQEGNAVYMADAYARISKKPSIVLGTLGPGVSNMVTGLTTANMDSVPVIAIGGTVTASESGRNSMQESSGRGRSPEQRLIFKACCKQAMFAPGPGAVPDLIREAFRVANTGRKGSVYLEIPDDYWNMKIDYKPLRTFQYQNSILPSCDPEKVKEIITQLYKAKQPLIMIGEGAEEKGISKLLMTYLDKVRIPFTVSPLAKNFVDEFDQYCLGAARGSGKTQKVYEYMKKSDFMLFLGARMHDPEMGWDNKSLVQNAKLAQVDIDEQEIGRVYPIDYSVVGSVSSFIQAVSHKKHPRAATLLKEIETLKKSYPRLKRYPDGKGINPHNIVNIVEELSNKDTAFVTDTGYVKGMSIVKLRTKLTQKFIVSDKNGSMGYGLPASLGASLAIKKQVVCLVGDGGVQMSINELGTAMNYGLKPIIIVFNNGGCVCVMDFHASKHGHYCAAAFKNPNYAKIAEAYGFKGYKVKSAKEFENVYKKAVKTNVGVVIDAIVDQSTMVWE
jgi:acetolactate synthase-1/2/3 large subunit